MTWPNSTKAGTTNVDAGSDKPALARADIKQNIDNVNAIIDTFDIASPSNGDILTYNSSNSAWEPGEPASSGGDFAIFGIAIGEQNVSGNTYRRALSEDFDPNGIIAVNSTYQLTLAAGNYIIESTTNFATLSSGIAETSVIVYNETNTSVIGTVCSYNQFATTDEGSFMGRVGFTAATQINISFRQTTENAQSRNATPTLLIRKF